MRLLYFISISFKCSLSKKEGGCYVLCGGRKISPRLHQCCYMLSGPSESMTQIHLVFSFDFSLVWLPSMDRIFVSSNRASISTMIVLLKLYTPYAFEDKKCIPNYLSSPVKYLNDLLYVLSVWRDIITFHYFRHNIHRYQLSLPFLSAYLLRFIAGFQWKYR